MPSPLRTHGTSDRRSFHYRVEWSPRPIPNSHQFEPDEQPAQRHPERVEPVAPRRLRIAGQELAERGQLLKDRRLGVELGDARRDGLLLALVLLCAF